MGTYLGGGKLAHVCNSRSLRRLDEVRVDLPLEPGVPLPAGLLRVRLVPVCQPCEDADPPSALVAPLLRLFKLRLPGQDELVGVVPPAQQALRTGLLVPIRCKWANLGINNVSTLLCVPTRV